ncbi:MAG TPA: AbrB/MazE/SpoVT family DNA-binding domain-containing protein [Bryobacteraceae bacterium]
MKTTVCSKGEVVLPAEIRRLDRVKPGQEFDVERLDRGDYRLVRRAARRNEGAIDLLLACPQKGFFGNIVGPGGFTRCREYIAKNPVKEVLAGACDEFRYLLCVSRKTKSSRG